MEYRISLTGDLGSGKTTVGKLIAEQTGCEIYSTGKICREIAAQKGIHDIKEMNLYMATHPEVDKEIDDGLVALSDRTGNLIVDSRMAWHFTKGTFKVYLSAALDVTSERIFKDNRAEESYRSVEELKTSMIARKASELSRYKELYGVNLYDMTNYDLVVDTTACTPEEAAGAIVEGCRAAAQGKPQPNGMLYAPRLFPTVELGQKDGDSDEVKVCCVNNNYYILSGHAAVMQAIRDKVPMLGCHIVMPVKNDFLQGYDAADFPRWFEAVSAAGARRFTRY